MIEETYKYSGMVISGHAYDNRVEVEVNEESDIFGFLEAARVVALGLTYQEGSWRRAIIELAEQYVVEDLKAGKR